MSNRIPRAFRDTKKVLSTKWSVKEMYFSTWAVNAIIYITVLRSLVYGLELLIAGSRASVDPFLGYVAIMGIESWGILMIVAVVILLIGVWSKNSILVTLGALLCSAIWFGFTITLCIGWAHLGQGGRYAIAAGSTAATWVVFFILQLKTIRRNGVES